LHLTSGGARAETREIRKIVEDFDGDTIVHGCVSESSMRRTRHEAVEGGHPRAATSTLRQRLR
jgi:hypothetical protein